MRVISEMSLTSFQFWAGAKANAEMLTYEELEQVGYVLEDIYEEIEDVTINDIFWFDFSWVCESIGIKYNEEEDIIIRDQESEEE
jgi:hypothetical protein